LLEEGDNRAMIQKKNASKIGYTVNNLKQQSGGGKEAKRYHEGVT
jgi:hypothetical protein